MIFTKFKNPLLFTLIVFLASCANLQRPLSPSSSSRPGDAISQLLAKDREAQIWEKGSDRSLSKAQKIENLSLGDVIQGGEPNTQSLYDDSRYDFPIVVNSKVEGWIDYFTGKGRSHMERYLERSSRYLPRMREIFKQAGLPEDLVYLALIESGFNLRAKSRARAVGPWQFMKATGKRYGLKVDSWVDERRDPILSTQAAAAYLKDLYLMFESWYLAASAYNAGEYKILRAIEELKTNNFWAIAQTNKIRRETKNYVPKLISAAIIAKNPAKYGFTQLSYQDPLEFEVIETDQAISFRELANAIDCSQNELLDLNPAYVKGRIPPRQEAAVIRIPLGSKVIVQRAISSNKGKYVASQRSTSLNSSTPGQVHTVRKGETLWSIADLYDTTVQNLYRWNGLTEAKIFPGYKLKVSSTVQKTTSKTGKRSVSSVPSDFIVHRVKKGESLWSISERYNVTIKQIFKWNQLNKSRIFPGNKIKIKIAKR